MEGQPGFPPWPPRPLAGNGRPPLAGSWLHSPAPPEAKAVAGQADDQAGNDKFWRMVLPPGVDMQGADGAQVDKLGGDHQLPLR